MDSSPAPKRKRARKPDGKYEGSGVGNANAWEATEIAPALPKDKYLPKPKVTGLSNNTAGKYGKKPKVTRPGLGKVTTTYN